MFYLVATRNFGQQSMDLIRKIATSCGLVFLAANPDYSLECIKPLSAACVPVANNSVLRREGHYSRLKFGVLLIGEMVNISQF